MSTARLSYLNQWCHKAYIVCVSKLLIRSGNWRGSSFMLWRPVWGHCKVWSDRRYFYCKNLLLSCLPTCNNRN